MAGKKKLNALKAELAALRANIMAETAAKLRELEEAGVQQAAELIQREQELSAYKAAAEAPRLNPLDGAESQVEQAGDERYADALHQGAGDYLQYEATKGTRNESGADNPFTRASQKYREQTQPATTIRVVDGRATRVPVTDKTWDVPPKQVAYDDIKGQFRAQGFTDDGRYTGQR